MEDLVVHGRLTLPSSEIEVRTSRSSGPGGQRLNKVETRVELRFDVRTSPSLGPDRRAKLEERLASRLTRDGVLIVASERHRERLRNLEDARERLAELIRDALVDVKPRRPTRPTRGSQKRRLEGKRHASEKKRGRRGNED